MTPQLASAFVMKTIAVFLFAILAVLVLADDPDQPPNYLDRVGGPFHGR